ncbi:putative glutamine amidotransferase [Tieghemostelium lacteum]|uniref:Putative glutamine amidotransferase n=1 Tax=Tieghemostelium lacteum TaxID=361077 RepID=A0A151ZGC8_TIELA|nr:putative glutamine amidotransferase [Tieghemostelium lacteum]|eukprot:KYQ92969.1 putative glutamine amidotransferase [Tieghemostelium lacteum]
MCRFIYYLGPPTKLSTIISEPSHGLINQSLHSTCPGLTLNADGFGVAWYNDFSAIPGVFKDITPAWSNINLRQLAKSTKSSCIMAHVRAASAGAIVNTNCHPFTFKNLSFMHNGTITYFSKLKRSILSMLSDTAFEMIKGTTDSEVLFALFITNYEKEIKYVQEQVKPSGAVYYSTHCQLEMEEKPYPPTGIDVLPKVLRETIQQIHRLILEFEIQQEILPKDYQVESGASMNHTHTCSKLNLAVTDGVNVVVSRYATGQIENAHTLYWSRGTTIQCDSGHCKIGRSCELSPMSLQYGQGNTIQHSLVISSEPLAQDFKCEEVPINHMVIGNCHGGFSIDAIN